MHLNMQNFAFWLLIKNISHIYVRSAKVFIATSHCSLDKHTLAGALSRPSHLRPRLTWWQCPDSTPHHLCRTLAHASASARVLKVLNSYFYHQHFCIKSTKPTNQHSNKFHKCWWLFVCRNISTRIHTKWQRSTTFTTSYIATSRHKERPHTHCKMMQINNMQEGTLS